MPGRLRINAIVGGRAQACSSGVGRKCQRRRLGSGCKSILIRGNNPLSIAAALEDGHTAWSGLVSNGLKIMTILSPFAHARSQPFDFLVLPALRSAQKPRRRGLTMMIDQGLPCAYIEDLVTTVGDYIDFAKIKSGTARLYPRTVLQRKMEIYKAHNI